MKFLVFQHVRSEDPGSFIEAMQAGGHAMQAVELDEGEKIPPLDGFDALLVMGGPQDVWETDKYPWLMDEIAAIGDWVRSGKPYLGICLGNQLLAMACGGHAQKMTAPPEVGVFDVELWDDPIFAGVARPAACFEWHGAEVVRLPPGAKQLGRSAGCEIQAMRFSECAYGLQFHPELTPEVGLKWGALPEYQAALERVRGPGALASVRGEVEAAYPRIRAVADTVFGNFLKIAAGVVGSTGG
jgi:GMP synthase-like glutamine amidotransferase